MDARPKVGIIFNYSENWIGGSYYILNIIHALNTLEDQRKPNIVVFTPSEAGYIIVKETTAYPYLNYQQYPNIRQYTTFEKAVNKVFKSIFKTKLIRKYPKYEAVDFLYPKTINEVSTTIKKVNWIPDFQEHYLPEYFSQEEIEGRKKVQKDIICQGDVAVLSSQDAAEDFKTFYPNAKAKTYVLPFAVTLPDFSKESIDVLRYKHNLPTDYFFAPNQFWAHKNHIVILKAVKYLKEKGVTVTVAMSGKESDYRNKENFDQLKDYITSNQLESQIKFLGFLPREEQLCLFKHSLAIIQPSLFEGWSTVVEDAKALNKFIILSDLKVHKEQIHDNAAFFSPHDTLALANLLQNYQLEQPPIIHHDYNNNVKLFGENILELINTYS